MQREIVIEYVTIEVENDSMLLFYGDDFISFPGGKTLEEELKLFPFLLSSGVITPTSNYCN